MWLSVHILYKVFMERKNDEKKTKNAWVFFNRGEDEVNLDWNKKISHSITFTSVARIFAMGGVRMTFYLTIRCIQERIQKVWVGGCQCCSRDHMLRDRDRIIFSRPRPGVFRDRDQQESRPTIIRLSRK